MSRWQPYNPNPHHSRTGDCPIRAICKAIDKDWEYVYVGLSLYGFMGADMPSANHIWGEYLERCGFVQRLVDKNFRVHYTVEDFCVDHPKGTFVLGCDGHVVTVVDGLYYDSWDSGGEVPIYYWERGLHGKHEQNGN